ncbi:MAG: polymer-forming cytoskeletal protein [Bacteroidetes bacterium]|nr:polymer-forming cytoskeletal protein [Bacteroidota bacterium]
MATDNNYPSVNILSEGSELEGHLNSEHDVRIGGYLSGTVTTKAKLIVSDHGQINGDVKAMQVDIAGKIEGNVFVKQKAVLRTGAVIEGNISAKILVVEEGAVINGLCRMSDDALITPSDESEFVRSEA